MKVESPAGEKATVGGYRKERVTDRRGPNLAEKTRGRSGLHRFQLTPFDLQLASGPASLLREADHVTGFAGELHRVGRVQRQDVCSLRDFPRGERPIRVDAQLGED